MNMATANFYLDTRRIKGNGKYPVRIRIQHKGKFLVSTDFDATPETWTGTEYNKKEQNYKAKNMAIRMLMNRAENILFKLEMDGGLVTKTDKDLKRIIEEELRPGKFEKKDMFIPVMEEFMLAKTKQSTAECYKGTIRKLEEYSPDCTFSIMDRKWLSEFNRHMLDSGMKINACGVHLRNIRAVFNYAIDEGYTEMYPFRKFSIANEKTRKRNLSLSDLVLLRDYDCEPFQRKYRDIFMLMFYLIGINAIDLFNAEKLNGNRLEYRRSKTSRLYSIKVEPEAMQIIERYKGETHLLDIMDNYANYKDFLHRMNDNLRRIGKVERKGLGGKKYISPFFPEISSYWSRHTWATIAASIDIPKDVIAAALGHGGNTVTDIYINFDMKKVDDANRKVIDYLNNARPE